MRLHFGRFWSAARKFTDAPLLLLYTWGLTRWLRFYNYGDLQLNSGDWKDYYHPYYSVLADAVSRMKVPFFSSSPVSYTETTLYLGIPEVQLLPQTFLLRYLALAEYFTLNFIFFYTAGFLGLWLLKQRLKLSWLGFTVVFLLFNFNGHIVAHLATGHLAWNTYFLLPIFVLLVLNLIDPYKKSVVMRTATFMAFLFLVFALAGGIHILIWCSMFLGLLALFNPSLIPPIAWTLVLGYLMSAVRILPAVVVFHDYNPLYLGGFKDSIHILEGLIIFRDFDYYEFPFYWWEYDYYVGGVGLLILVYWGLYRGRGDERLKILGPALTVMALFSIGDFYKLVHDLKLPLFTTQRVSSRLFIIPLVFVIVLAGHHLSQVRFKDLRTRVFAWLLVFVMGLELTNEVRRWSIPLIESHAASAEAVVIGVQPYNFEHLSSQEQLYVYAVYGGAVISLIAIVVAVGIILKFRQNYGF